jgi:AraC family transcriptional regulator, regulatory protein of adaptative response / methylphosphotriester-DNA alkyltransferase methyltransferase
VRQATRHRRGALFDEALAAIARDYTSDDVSLGSVAHSIATSRRQLQRVFAERGTSFRSELQQVRMTRAAELLHDGELPVSAVARAVGYRQPAQFSKAFRRHHGCPPSTLRAAGERGRRAMAGADGRAQPGLGRAQPAAA